MIMQQVDFKSPLNFKNVYKINFFYVILYLLAQIFSNQF